MARLLPLNGDFHYFDILALLNRISFKIENYMRWENVSKSNVAVNKIVHICKLCWAQ